MFGGQDKLMMQILLAPHLIIKHEISIIIDCTEQPLYRLSSKLLNALNNACVLLLCCCILRFFTGFVMSDICNIWRIFPYIKSDITINVTYRAKYNFHICTYRYIWLIAYITPHLTCSWYLYDIFSTMLCVLQPYMATAIYEKKIW